MDTDPDGEVVLLIAEEAVENDTWERRNRRYQAFIPVPDVPTAEDVAGLRTAMGWGADDWRAFDHLDGVNRTVADAADRPQAHSALTARPFGYTDLQAFHILNLSVGSQTAEGRADLEAQQADLLSWLARLDAFLAGGGTSNNVQTSMKVTAPGIGRARDLTVVTMVKEPPRTEETILWMLLGSDLPDPPIFPATSTVHRGKLSMRVVGRRRLVTIYLCGAAWVARTRTAGRWLWLEGYATDPRTIEIVRLDETALEAALALSEQVTRWMSDQTRPNPLRSF